MIKIKRKSLVMISIILVISSMSFADFDLSNFVNKTYYLKHNLIFLDMTSKIFPDHIRFTEKKINCSTPLWGFTIAKSAEIQIIKMVRKDLFIEVEMRVANKENFTILLSSKDKQDFTLSFDEIFSKNEVKETPRDCSHKTTKDLIECYGHPIYKCFKNGNENWYYNQGFIGRRIDGFHDVWIEIKDGTVLSIWGHI